MLEAELFCRAMIVILLFQIHKFIAQVFYFFVVDVLYVLVMTLTIYTQFILFYVVDAGVAAAVCLLVCYLFVYLFVCFLVATYLMDLHVSISTAIYSFYILPAFVFSILQ